MTAEFAIHTSADVKDDPEEAKRQLEKTTVAIFIISPSWFDDERAQAEYRYARKLNKPMVLMFDMKNGINEKYFNKFLFDYPHLIATINIYDEGQRSSKLLRAVLEAYASELDDSLQS